MNLIIDIGNTFAKTAVMEGAEILHKTVARELSCTALEEVLHTHPAIDRAILSTTRNPDPAVEAYLQEHVPCFVRFTPATPVPLVNRYATPETLGADRLAAAVGAWDIAPERELLIVDLGSAITLDRVSAAGEYLGGNISPGMAMRFEGRSAPHHNMWTSPAPPPATPSKAAWCSESCTKSKDTSTDSAKKMRP